MSYVFLNDWLTPSEEAKISVFDRGFAYGDALFETVKIMDGRPVFFVEHINRLNSGMRKAGFEVCLDPEQLKPQIGILAEKNDIQNGRLRILVSRGTPQERPNRQGPEPGNNLEPTVLLTASPFERLSSEYYENGVSCITVPGDRGRFASLKSTGLMQSILTRKEASAAGAWEAIFSDKDGGLLEGVYSNFFCLIENVLITAPENAPILPGIIRQKIIEAAPQLDLSLDLRTPNIIEVKASDNSAFLTSTLMGACPLKSINEAPLKIDFERIDRLRQKLQEMEEKSIASYY